MGSRRFGARVADVRPARHGGDCPRRAYSGGDAHPAGRFRTAAEDSEDAEVWMLAITNGANWVN